MIVSPGYSTERATYSLGKVQLPGRAGAISGRRYYNPRDGRFIGRDPIEEKGGLHLYAFCGNNGINKFDYLGMDGIAPYILNDPNLLSQYTFTKDGVLYWKPDFTGLARPVYDKDWTPEARLEYEFAASFAQQTADGYASAFDFNLGWHEGMSGGSKYVPTSALRNTVSYDTAFRYWGGAVKGGDNVMILISGSGEPQLVGVAGVDGRLSPVGVGVTNPGGLDAGVNLDLVGDRSGAGSIVTPSGTYKILVHGSPDLVQVGDKLYTADQFAAELVSNPNYNYQRGTAIVLISCGAGGVSGFGENFAQSLANIVGAPVVAPTNTVMVSPGDNVLGPPGTLTVATPVTDANTYVIGFTNVGGFVVYNPQPTSPGDTPSP